MITMFAMPAVVIIIVTVIVIAMPIPELGYKTVANAGAIRVTTGNKP